jgi:tetratricopeptide (TPR) repeat protein
MWIRFAAVTLATVVVLPSAALARDGSSYSIGKGQDCAAAAAAGAHTRADIRVCSEALDEVMSRPERAGVLVNRGAIYMADRNLDAAIADFDEAIALTPDLGEAWINRGTAYRGRGDFARSVADITRGLELGVAEPAKAHYNRGLAHEGLNDMKSAYLDYKQAVALAPDWAPPQNELKRFTVATKK